MTEPTRQSETEILQRAIDRWGVRLQSNQCIQEMAELIVAITKLQQLYDAPHTEQIAARDNLIEEIADVEIMIDQMKLMYGEQDIRKQRDYKLQRLVNRLDALQDEENKLFECVRDKWEVW